MNRFRLCLSLVVVTSAALRGDTVDKFVQAEMKAHNIPGISIAVIKNGQLLKAQGYGLANVDLNARASAESVYQLASVTKQLTAAAIVLLAQEKRLHFDDKISSYFPDTPRDWSEITIRHLLTMTSGIKDYNGPLGSSREDFDYPKLWRIIAGFPLDFEPGQKWAYSNSNYILLAMLIQRLTGAPWDQFLANRLFKPLGMTATRRDDPFEIVKNRVALYETESNRLVNCKFVNPTLFNNGDGGLLTTVLDMAKWDAVLYPGKLFKAATLAEMWEPVSFNGTVLKHYGFGWYLNQAGDQRIVLHGGGRPGSSTQFSRFLDAKLSVVVLINRSGINAERMAHQIAAFYIPDLPPYAPSGIRNPPKWNATGELLPPRE